VVKVTEGIDTIDSPYYTRPMAMGKRTREQQAAMWVAVGDLPRSVSHPFYEKLNQLLAEQGFDDFVETQCQSFYADRLGRPSLVPGRYFRLLLLGYFEGLDSERGIAWRAADSLGVRAFLRLALTDVVMLVARTAILGRHKWDQAKPVCFLLKLTRHHPDIDHNAVHLNHPDQRVVRQLAGQTPTRIKLRDPQQTHDLARFRRARTLADAEEGAQVTPTHMGRLRVVKEEVDHAQGVRDATGPRFHAASD
jgi:hypothetical protein